VSSRCPGPNQLRRTLVTSITTHLTLNIVVVALTFALR
jgi:hypothetical protein